MVRVYSGKKLGQDLLSETGTPGMYSLPNKGVQISSKGTKNTHDPLWRRLASSLLWGYLISSFCDSDVREGCPDVPWSPSCFLTVLWMTRDGQMHLYFCRGCLILVWDERRRRGRKASVLIPCKVFFTLGPRKVRTMQLERSEATACITSNIFQRLQDQKATNVKMQKFCGN